MHIVALLPCLQPAVTKTTRCQCSRIALAMLVMTGCVTTLGLSRWAGPGGSDRTVQRFFSTVIPWATLFWVCFRQQVYGPADVYLLGDDAVVATTAGKQTSGLDRFFASLYGKPVPGLAFFALSLVSTQQRRAFPIRVAQVVRGALLHMIAGMVSLPSVVLDGHCGNHNALAMANQHNRHLIAKLRGDAALSFPSASPYAGRGPRRTDGDKGDDDTIPAPYLNATTVEGPSQTCLYQGQLLHKECAQPLPIVIIVKTNLRTQARAQVVLFSSDVARRCFRSVHLLYRFVYIP